MKLLTTLVPVLLLLQAVQPGASLEERLWRHRNLGKAFYENPTTQKEAVAEFKHALDLARDSKRERLNYALAVLRAGQTAEAVAQLEAVQKAAPELPHTWFNLGITWKKQGDFDKALAQFVQFVKLAPNEPVGHYNLGVLLRQEGKTEDAVREFQRAAQLNPIAAAPHFQLFNLYRTTNRQQESARELAEFQRLKKEQEGAAIPEDMEWCDYAEVYDPVEDRPGGKPGEPRYLEQKLPSAVDAATAGFVPFGTGAIVWSSKGVVSRLPGLENQKDVKFIAPGDFDNDGKMDIAVVGSGAVSLCRNEGIRFACRELTKGSFESAAWVDYDHDYDLDLFLFGVDSMLMRNQGKAGFADHTKDFPFVRGHARRGEWVRVAPDSKAFDIAVQYADHAPVIYADQLNGKYGVEAGTITAPRDPLAVQVAFAPAGATIRTPRLPVSWIRVELAGVKNLKLGQGSIVEVKSGTLYQRKHYEGIPLLFDLGTYREADTVRITWPNGLIQNEVHQAGRKAYLYKEAQRLSGSCPMIWTWNGREFEFLTDVLGVAPLGATSGDGSYFPVDHDEYVLIPARQMAERDGVLEMRITEELSEVTYLDQAQLFAVDHPADTEIFLNEKWKGPPFPEFRYYGSKNRNYPVSARDHRGRGVRGLVVKRDQRYPAGFARSETGVAELHELTLDFAGAARDNRAVLVLNGWVDWADGSTFLAASQASKEGLVPPYLQVKNERGEWQTVIEDMGIPDGKPKTMAVDLAGKFLSDSREVRIVTNLCVYWDEVFLSESSTPPEVRQTRVPLDSADLHYRGFSATKIHPERLQPDQFFYSSVSATSYWNPTPGRYTRYGDVRELLEGVDDRFVIMGSGDEIRLRFASSGLPPVPKGWTREYMVKVDGWAKDRDANTAYSQSVEPLPFHGMSQYPYPAGERFPDDEVHRRYRQQFNTRPALRLIRDLQAAR